MDYYKLDASSGALEIRPYVIAPDSNPDIKRWIFLPPSSTTSLKTLKKQISILKELHFRLDGKCSQKGSTCPINIKDDLMYDPSEPVWDCDDCFNNFDFLIDPKRRKERMEKKNDEYCPCTYGISSEIVILRLEEVIEELQQESNTWFPPYKVHWKAGSKLQAISCPICKRMQRKI